MASMSNIILESSNLTNREWLKLPPLIWTLTFHRLDLLDRIRFSAACSFFRSIATKKQSLRMSRAVLLLPPTKDSETREFLSLMDAAIYKTHLPELTGKWCCGSSFGYLFTVDFKSGCIDLFNPFSRARISLPPLSAFPDPVELDEIPERNNIRFIVKTTVSTNPSEGNNLIVFTIITVAWILAFCQPGDESWTILPIVEGPVEDILYFKDKFYAVTNWDALISWDLSDVNSPEVTVLIPVNEDNPLQDYLIGRRYLVESTRGELLIVYRIGNWKENEDESRDDDYYSTDGFMVFKLYESDDERKKLVPACLCSQALFVGYNRAICVCTVEHPEFVQHGIYFTDDFAEQYEGNPYGCNDIGLYDQKSGTVEKFHDFPFWTDPCIWVAPNSR